MIPVLFFLRCQKMHTCHELIKKNVSYIPISFDLNCTATVSNEK